jgi:hypothetical protein
MRLALLALLAAPAAANPAPFADPADGTESLYQRCLRRALERSQAEARRGLDLWIDHTQWENAWVVSTEHFRVRTNTTRQVARWAADSLEGMWPTFTSVLGEGIAAGGPYEVHVYRTIAEYNAIGDAHGAHHSSIYGSFYAAQHPDRPVACLTSDNWTLLGMQLTHSVAHALIERNFPNTPPVWLAEGLACYFAAYWDYPWVSSELKKMTAHGRFPVYVPLERLVTTDLDQYGDNTHARFIELGMWVNYLLHFRDGTRTVLAEDGSVVESPFLDYLRDLLRGRDVSNSPITQLFENDRAQLEQDFMQFEFGS